MLRSLGRYQQAVSSLRHALGRKPGNPTAGFALAFVQLTLGDFKQGWPLYEARFDEPELAVPARDFGVPRWDGRDLTGRTLLVHAEQGLGDPVHFCRYLPLLAAQGVSVVFEVMPALTALMRSLPGAVRVSGRGEPLPPA